MDKRKRHKRAWRFAFKLLGGYFRRKFNYTPEECTYDGPCVIISNHVTNWDPPLLGLSFPNKNLYYVASEHLFRMGFKTKLLNRYFEPIPRSKGSSAVDTVLKCLRHFKQGDSVCIFAEGDSTWNGVTDEIVPSTANLVKSSRVALLTYKFEGGHLSNPRWGKGVRKGKMRGGVINIYTPEQLKKMSVEEILECINRDIYENAWERQNADPVAYKGKNKAVRMESALFLCPECKKIGTLKGVGDKITCSCGFCAEYTELGTYEPATPFKNIYEWDTWQKECLKSKDFIHGEEYFSDHGVHLTELLESHKSNLITTDTLVQHEDRISVGKKEFFLKDISSMSIIQTSILVFTCGSSYYEIRTDKEQYVNMRKYLLFWKNYTDTLRNSTQSEV